MLMESMIEEGVGFFGIWPVTADDDWCGRFKKKMYLRRSEQQDATS